MFKRIIAVCLIVLAVLPAMFAANGQRIIPLSSGLYDAMDALFMLEGKAMPSSVRPWSAAEAENGAP